MHFTCRTQRSLPPKSWVLNWTLKDEKNRRQEWAGAPPREHPFQRLGCKREHEAFEDFPVACFVSTGCQREEMKDEMARSQIPKGLLSCVKDLERYPRGDGHHQRIWPLPTPQESCSHCSVPSPALSTPASDRLVNDHASSSPRYFSHAFLYLKFPPPHIYIFNWPISFLSFWL